MTERDKFEAWAKAPPREWSTERFSHFQAWPNQYADYKTQCAWEAWDHRAALPKPQFDDQDIASYAQESYEAKP